jgi:hypothetical protein
MNIIRLSALGWLAALFIIPSLGLANQDNAEQERDSSIVVEETEYQYENLSLDEGPNKKEARKKAMLSNLEPGLGLGLSSWDGNFTMQINASLGYYVLNWLQPGLELSYITDFGTSGYPDSFRILPFLKFVFMRGKSFAPYVMAAGGREFQWAGDYPVNSWIVGPGVGAYIGAGKRIVINVEVLFLHYWYDDPRVVGYPDDSLYTDGNGDTYPCPDGHCDLDSWYPAEDQYGDSWLCESEDGDQCVPQVNDKKDRDRDWIFPIISLGVGFLF